MRESLMEFASEHITSKLLTMLKYQEALNDVFAPDWRTERYPYLRAAVVEGGEMIDHHGYKWWKLQSKDLGQMQLELVDIIHFYLSEVARHYQGNAAQVLRDEWVKDEAQVQFDGKLYVLSEMSLLDKVELMIGLAVSRRICWSLYRSVLADSEMTFMDLYHQYAGKNVLNLFRQHNGDKKGTYIKVWAGKEDNIHLTELMAEWTPEETMDDLYVRLSDRYKQLTGQ